MKYGGWIPISKTFARDLPHNRPFSRLEAAFSLQLDYDQGRQVTLTGYSKLWRWSKGKVIRFLKEMGIQIKYPDSTVRKQNQRGLIMNLITDRSPTENGLIRLIDSKRLGNKADRKETENRLKADRSRYTTRDPNPDPDKKNEIPFTEIVSHLNDRTGKRFRSTSKNAQKWIKARWADGYRLVDFKCVIDTKVGVWGNDPKMSAYLRPETLFGPKFEAYLNENGGKTEPVRPRSWEL